MTPKSKDDAKPKKSKKKSKKRFYNFNQFTGKQLARLRFGVTYIQMLYYAVVILGAIVLVIGSVIGQGVIGWEISLVILIGIFVLEWGLGYYTEKAGIIKKDRIQGNIQNIPANIIVQGEVWKEAVIPQMDEMFGRVLSKTLGKIDIPNKEKIVEEVKKSIKEKQK